LKRRIELHRLLVFTATAAALGTLMPITAESFKYGKLVAGQVQTALVYGSGTSWCFINDGSTEFQISQETSKAVISFPEFTFRWY
jgi:hypothetical protein